MTFLLVPNVSFSATFGIEQEALESHMKQSSKSHRKYWVQKLQYLLIQNVFIFVLIFDEICDNNKKFL